MTIKEIKEIKECDILNSVRIWETQLRESCDRYGGVFVSMRDTNGDCNIEVILDSNTTAFTFVCRAEDCDRLYDLTRDILEREDISVYNDQTHFIRAQRQEI